MGVSGGDKAIDSDQKRRENTRYEFVNVEKNLIQL